MHLYITKADEKVPEKVIDSISKRIEEKGGKVVDSFSITTIMKRIIKPEDIRESVSEWVNSLNVK